MGTHSHDFSSAINMVSCKEISKLAIDMNLTTGSGRPSRNSQGIHNASIQPTIPTTPLPETPVNTATTPHTPTTTLPAGGLLFQSNSSAVSDTSNPNTSIPNTTHIRQVEVLTPCARQYNRFVDPQGRPLQPGMVIFCADLPFIVSENGKIYNYTGGNMKQLYVADPREHKFLVNEANRPSTITNILGLVSSMLPGFSKKPSSTAHNSKEIEEQTPTTPEVSTIVTASTIDNINNGKTDTKGNNIYFSTVETSA